MRALALPSVPGSSALSQITQVLLGVDMCDSILIILACASMHACIVLLMCMDVCVCIYVGL